MSNHKVIKGIEVTIPKSLNDLTLGQYLKYVKATSGEVKLDEVVESELLVTIFCNIQLRHLNLLSNNQVNDIATRLVPVVKEMSNLNADFKHRFTLNGVEYGMINNLDEISYGENKDITTFISSIENNHLAMGVLFRPIIQKQGDKYEIEDYKGVTPEQGDVMLDMPLDVFIGAHVFFWNLTRELLKNIPSYLVREMGEENYKELMQKASINTTGEVMMKSFALLKEI